MSPPTVLLLFLALGQIGLLLAFRDKLVSPRLDAALGWLGPRFMSVYLWHMPALVVVSGVTVLGLRYATPEPGSSLWFLMVPAWVFACGVVLLCLLRLFERFETQPDDLVVTARTPQLVIAGLLASGGLLGLAAHGFAPLSDNLGPMPWVALTATGFVLAGRQLSAPRLAMAPVKR